MTIAEFSEKIMDTLEPSEIREFIEHQQVTINRKDLKIEMLKIEIKSLNESIEKRTETAMGVIKRQDAEIERLQNYINGNKTRTEIIKEFAERLKAKINNPQCPWEDFPLRESDIDEVLKEMVGDESGT